VGLPKIILYQVSRMLTLLLGGLGFAFDYTGASVLSWTPDNWRTVGFIAFGVFVILTLLREIDLALQQRAKIKVNPVLSNRNATLEVENKGASAKLIIRGRITQGSSITNIYDICVIYINKNDKKSILIAEVRKSLSIFQKWIDFPKMTTADRNISDEISRQLIDNLLIWDRYPEMRNQSPIYEIILEIVLTTDITATKILGTRNYSLKIDEEHGLQFTGCE